MDVSLARTFLIVAESGSFIDAARKMNITQSTVSARIKGLEDLLGRPLFIRSKAGAELTGAGELFQKHALAMVRVWSQAQLQVSLADKHPDHVSVGAPLGLWSGFLMKWVAGVRTEIPGLAVSATAGASGTLSQRLIEGTLDIAILYRPSPPPGLTIEHLFDEEFLLVTTVKTPRQRANSDYLLVDWCADFLRDHAAAFPELANPAVNLDLGPMSLDYLLSNACSGYFPARMVRRLISRGRINEVKRSRRFTYPVYMVYPETRNEEAYEPIMDGLRRAAGRMP
jgi:LysR family transcriptional regulator, flagellar master operon regulator